LPFCFSSSVNFVDWLILKPFPSVHPTTRGQIRYAVFETLGSQTETAIRAHISDELSEAESEAGIAIGKAGEANERAGKANARAEAAGKSAAFANAKAKASELERAKLELLVAPRRLTSTEQAEIGKACPSLIGNE